MEELLNCSVCAEKFNDKGRQPVLLPRCGHSYCRPCITMLASGGCVVCPACRMDQRVDSVDRLPTEFTLLAVIKAQDNSKKETCSHHGVKLSFWCVSCKKPACGECLFEDHPTQSHTVIKASEYISGIKQSAKDVTCKFMDCLDDKERHLYDTIFNSAKQISLSLREIPVLRKDVDETRNLMKAISEEVKISSASSLAETAKFLALKWNIRCENYEPKNKKRTFSEGTPDKIGTVKAALCHPDERQDTANTNVNLIGKIIAKEQRIRQNSHELLKEEVKGMVTEPVNKLGIADVKKENISTANSSPNYSELIRPAVENTKHEAKCLSKEQEKLNSMNVPSKTIAENTNDKEILLEQKESSQLQAQIIINKEGKKCKGTDLSKSYANGPISATDLKKEQKQETTPAEEKDSIPKLETIKEGNAQIQGDEIKKKEKIKNLKKTPSKEEVNNVLQEVTESATPTTNPVQQQVGDQSKRILIKEEINNKENPQANDVELNNSCSNCVNDIIVSNAQSNLICEIDERNKICREKCIKNNLKSECKVALNAENVNKIIPSQSKEKEKIVKLDKIGHENIKTLREMRIPTLMKDDHTPIVKVKQGIITNTEIPSKKELNVCKSHLEDNVDTNNRPEKVKDGSASSDIPKFNSKQTKHTEMDRVNIAPKSTATISNTIESSKAALKETPNAEVDSDKHTITREDDMEIEEPSSHPEAKMTDCIQVEGFMIAVESLDGRLGVLSWGTQGLHAHCLQSHRVEYDILIKTTVLNSMIPSKSPTIFLELSTEETVIGRVYIQLWGHLKRAENFLTLCLGEKGYSFIDTKFFQVYNVDGPGERILGGDFESNDGRGGKTLIEDLEWNSVYALPMEAGMLTAAGSGKDATNSLFLICTKSDPSRNFSCPFGTVYDGLSVVHDAICLTATHQVIISDCGALLIPPKLQG